jgi:hypothetical protein
MGSNTITPPLVLNRNSSDEEILGLPTHAPRRTVRREANREGRDSSAQDSGTRTNEQLAMDFGDEEVPEGTRRGSATDAEAAGANATRQLEPEHLRAALGRRNAASVSVQGRAMRCDFIVVNYLRQ